MMYGDENICLTCGQDRNDLPENCDQCGLLSKKNKRIQKYTIALCAISTFGFFIKIVFL